MLASSKARVQTRVAPTWPCHIHATVPCKPDPALLVPDRTGTSAHVDDIKVEAHLSADEPVPTQRRVWLMFIAACLHGPQAPNKLTGCFRHHRLRAVHAPRIGLVWSGIVHSASRKQDQGGRG
jgi:hypothetical protein